MEQRITRAKRRIAEARSSVRDAGRGRAGRAARRRRGDDLPGLQRRLFGERRRRLTSARRSARRRSGWRGCCCGCFQAEPEIMGLTALLLLQHARAPARLRCGRRHRAARGSGPRSLEREMIAEGLALVDKAMRHRRPGPTRCRPRSRRCTRARRGPRRRTGREIDCSMRVLERLQPSPVVTLNRAVAVSKVRGAGRRRWR